MRSLVQWLEFRLACTLMPLDMCSAQKRTSTRRLDLHQGESTQLDACRALQVHRQYGHIEDDHTVLGRRPPALGQDELFGMAPRPDVCRLQRGQDL